MIGKATAVVCLLVLFAGSAVAQGASRTSEYRGPAGSGKKFQEAKVGLLNQYAKAKATTWTPSNEKLTDTYYAVTYTFPTAAILADFQKWQYEQKSYKDVLEKTSLKAKGATGRKML